MGHRHPGQIWRAGKRVDVTIAAEFQVCDRCERIGGDYRAPCPTPVATDEQLAVWRTYLSRWRLEYPVRLRLGAVVDHNRHLRITFDYDGEPDASDGDGETRDAEESGGLLAPSLLPDEDTPRWIRANVQYHLGHELDEHIRLDGARVFDPHADAVYECDECREAMKTTR